MPSQPIDLPQITAQLAEALTLAGSGAWTHEADDCQWVQALTSPDGHTLDVEHTRTTGRLCVRVCFGELYRFLPRDHPSYQCTLNPQRPIGDLARAIRRLLDQARPAIAEAQARKADADDFTARCEQLAAQLAARAGYERAAHETTTIYIGYGQQYGRSRGSGRMRVDSPECVTLELRVPSDLASAILALMYPA